MGPNRLPLRVQVIRPAIARQVAEERHYTRRKPMVSWAFGHHLNDELVGIQGCGVVGRRPVRDGSLGW